LSTVLIIEDSPTEAHVYKRALEKIGITVDIASDGEAGISRAVAQRPDVILMDIVMPGVNGFQATRELRDCEATAGIPVIMISTKQQETDRIWGMRQGAVDYLVKPVSRKVLLASVQAALAETCND